MVNFDLKFLFHFFIDTNIWYKHSEGASFDELYKVSNYDLMISAALRWLSVQYK